MTSRYCYCTMHNGRITMRISFRERVQRYFRKRWKKEEEPDVYMVTGFFPPVWIRH